MGINYFHRAEREFQFLLHEYLEVEKFLAWEAFQGFRLADFDQVVAEAHGLAAAALGPALQDGDRQGCRKEADGVKAPAAFHPAWQALAQGGWLGVSNRREAGGKGLPLTIGALANEGFFGANAALTVYALLTSANARMLERFGSDQERELFLEPLLTGRWAGTMCLTEPLAGSDVGWLETQATPEEGDAAGRIYRLKGAKRFITGGEHDLTENIVHLVLARIAGAPQGTKGISLFLVPRRWVNPDGSLGPDNDVHCTAIEEKMGLHGSATCALRFGRHDGCRGVLLGEPQTGMAKMFHMMNEARLGTALMSLSLAASAYDAAKNYAQKRVQGPPFHDRRGERVPIIEHGDVRRMLMNLRAGSEAMRAFLGRTYQLLDVAGNHPDATVREKSLARVELFTPVAKAFCSDLAFQLCAEAVQVFGGSGYCQEFPVEQYLREVKVFSIWEGTNYIQALDLVGRKLPMRGGEVFRGVMEELAAWAQAHQDDAQLGPSFKLLGQAVQATGGFALQFAAWAGEGRTNLIELQATAFLACLGKVLLARALLEQGLLAGKRLQDAGLTPEDAAFYQAKLASARFFAAWMLPQVGASYQTLQSEDAAAWEIPSGAF
ncbi:MAG: acyl-CoA dehydrogenase [Deltaproteobacteria bacterium]|nr:acyl-CoA dehydrogenase [Deltaproteobacteria bacterium]